MNKYNISVSIMLLNKKQIKLISKYLKIKKKIKL